MRTRRPAMAVLLALPLALAAAAQPGPKFATRDEYRACLDDEDGMKPQRAAMQQRLQAHHAELKQHQDEMNALVAEQPRVDTTDQHAVDAFNARMDALNARVNDINARGEQFNRDQMQFNARIVALNKRCAALIISVRDRDAVLKERAAKAAAR